MGIDMLELGSIVACHAKFRPNSTAVVFEDERLTWRAFGARVARCANALRDLGVHKGDRVVTVLGNCRALLEVYWACPSIGAVLVPSSPLLTAAGFASLLHDCKPACVVTDRASLRAIRDAQDAAALAPAALLVVDASDPDAPDYEAATARAGETLVPEAVTPDDVFNIMYTSGTTGQPKGIVHTHFIRSMYALLMGAAWRMTPESVVLHTGAIVFNGAFVTLMPSFYLGGTYVFHRQFDAAHAIETIERERVTHVMLVPSQIIAILNAPQFRPERLASLEMMLSLGAPLHQEYKERLNAALPDRFYELYGLTEGFVTILDRSEAIRKAGSVGKPPPFYRMRIVHDDGSDCAPGEVGEIVGRGPILMRGYYNRPDLTAEAIRDGWLHTGDLGYVDDDGYLYLVDRKKDMIDSGGVKVYPKDVEEIAIRHPAILEVAVFGVPDEKWGETPHAAVVLREGENIAPDALRDWINERVAARYQRVSAVSIVPSFPRSAAGKILKRELRAPYWAGRKAKI
jgi:acyl-CoA synthetase (AMP-forming)/AMP-acid ligase II